MDLGDRLKASSMRGWTLTCKNRFVKVVSPAGEQAMAQYGSAMGYVTQEKYLNGLTAPKIERALGLRPFELRQMARIHALQRLPRFDDVEFRLTCAFPDGGAFEAAEEQERVDARIACAKSEGLYERSMTPVVQYYPPGSNRIFQWKLTNPVPVAGLIATVTHVVPFPRENGSIKPYTPHNRGGVV